MADPVGVKIVGGATTKYPKLAENVRAVARNTIIIQTKRLALRVKAKLQPGVLFKTTTRLLPAVTTKLIESNDQIYGYVFIDPRKFPDVVAKTLESGSKAHDIVGNPYLAFYFGKLGRNVVFRKVHHPGYPGKSYMQSSLAESEQEMTLEVKEQILATVNDEAGKGRITVETK